VVLHVHLPEGALLGAGLARVQEANGPITAEQVRTWCGNPDTKVIVRPVLDLAEHIHVESYEASARLKNQVDLRDRTCVFPFCMRRAERCDHDHRVDHDDGGPTCSCNIAPTCRRRHRAKTTGERGRGRAIRAVQALARAVGPAVPGCISGTGPGTVGCGRPAPGPQ
jgi:hypothetical protein